MIWRRARRERALSRLVTLTTCPHCGAVPRSMSVHARFECPAIQVGDL